jgi:hypothetical protein
MLSRDPDLKFHQQLGKLFRSRGIESTLMCGLISNAAHPTGKGKKFSSASRPLLMPM